MGIPAPAHSSNRANGAVVCGIKGLHRDRRRDARHAPGPACTGAVRPMRRLHFPGAACAGLRCPDANAILGCRIRYRTMSEPRSAQEFIQQVFRLLPEDLRTARADLEKHLRAAISAVFARMDLVTREEFDVQAALLSRTRALLDEMEAKVAELERRLDGGKRAED